MLLLMSCQVDLSMDGIAGREGSHVKVCTVAYLVEYEQHGGEVGMCYRCIYGSQSHGS